MFLDYYSFTFGFLSAIWITFILKYLNVPRNPDSEDEVSESDESSSIEEINQADILSSLEKCLNKVTELMNNHSLPTFQKLKDNAKDCFAEKNPETFIKKMVDLLKEIENIEVENLSPSTLLPKPSTKEPTYNKLERTSYTNKYSHLVGMSYKEALEEVSKDGLTLAIANYSLVESLPDAIWVTIDDPEFDTYYKAPSEKAKIIGVN